MALEEKSRLIGDMLSLKVVVIGVSRSISREGCELHCEIALSCSSMWSAKCELNIVDTGRSFSAMKSVVLGGALRGCSCAADDEIKGAAGGRRSKCDGEEAPP